MFFPLFSVTMYSNRRPNVLSCFFFFIIIIFFCHVFPKTLQPISTKLSDLCHDKICKKHTSCLLVLTSGPEIIKIYKFAFFFGSKQFFSKSVNERVFKLSGMVKIFQPLCPLHIQTSAVTSGCHQKKIKKIFLFKFFYYKYFLLIFDRDAFMNT